MVRPQSVLCSEVLLYSRGNISVMRTERRGAGSRHVVWKPQLAVKGSVCKMYSTRMINSSSQVFELLEGM